LVSRMLFVGDSTGDFSSNRHTYIPLRASIHSHWVGKYLHGISRKENMCSYQQRWDNRPIASRRRVSNPMMIGIYLLPSIDNPVIQFPTSRPQRKKPTQSAMTSNAQGAINVVLDIIVLGLPLPVIAKLQPNKRKKGPLLADVHPSASSSQSISILRLPVVLPASFVKTEPICVPLGGARRLHIGDVFEKLDHGESCSCQTALGQTTKLLASERECVGF
jgi:hypothetical protein